MRPEERLRVFCVRAMLAVGFMAMRAIRGLLLVIPPFIPPALLEAVVPLVAVIGSLFWEPRSFALVKESLRANGRVYAGL